MRVAELLLKILEDLLKADFDEFKWFLTLDLLGGCEPIPRCRLQDASRIETVDILLKRYGEEKAVKVAAEVLKKMKMNKATEDLMCLYAAGETHKSATLWKCLCSLNVPYFHPQEEAHHLHLLPLPPPLLPLLPLL